MRIEAIQLQGLSEAEGSQRLELGPGYSLIVVPQPAAALPLRAVLEASLYPHSCGEGLLPWLRPSGPRDAAGADPRASVTLRAEGSTGGILRVLCQPARRRVYLGRLDARARVWRRVASDPPRIEAGLRRLGLPGPDALFEERGLGWSMRPSAAPASGAQRGTLERELERAVEAQRTLVPLERRLDELRAARREREELERELSQAHEDGSPLAFPLEELEGIRERVDHYRTELAKRDRQRDQVGRTRLALLDERTRLRAVPAGQRPWMWLGLALAAAGAVAARLLGAWLGLFALAGLSLFGVALGRSEAARRRLEGLDRRLASLRVRERAIEREFESQTVGVRGLLATLGVDSSEALVLEADRLERMREKAAPLRERLAQARERFGDAAAAELADLERRASELASGPSEAELQARLAELPPATAPAPGLRAPDPSEPRPGPFAEVLPLYLRSLSRGRVRSARAEAGRWRFFDAEGRELRLDPIPAPLVLALRLAGIEAAATAATASVPLLVGPELPDLEAGERDALARALRRLGRLVQVVQISQEEEPWKSRASRVVPFSSGPGSAPER
ncbi:MAG: hypothetical protein ACE5IL_11480 [Myxococcota bacterium]